MAQQTQTQAHAERGDYSAEFWVQRGLSESPSTREKFIALTIDELARTGPYSFNATLICDLLGTTYPMVNHYFGNRDGLVAEATVVAYAGYVRGLAAAVEAAPQTPEDRMRAWIREQIRWTGAHAGIAVILDFPHASLEVTKLLESYQDELTTGYEFNMALAMQLVLDMRNNRVTPITFTPGDIPRTELMSDQDLVYRASSITLSTFGVAVWLAGGHVPSGATEEIRRQLEVTIDWHVDQLVKLAAGN